MAHNITDVKQLLSCLQDYQLVVIMVTHEATERQNASFVAEQRRAKSEFHNLASRPDMRRLPVRFAVHDLYSQGERGDIQEYCKTASVPYVAVCSQAGVLKHWSKYDEAKITRTIQQSLRRN